MNKKIFLYLTFIGLISLLFSCSKDGNLVYMSANPVKPTIATMPSLSLSRAHAKDTLTFVGTPIDPGFVVSTNYYLEACAHGNNFVNSIPLLNQVQDISMKITVSALNGIFLKYFPQDATSSVDFRIRAVMVVSAGTGAPGTGSSTAFTYISTVSNANVTIYGLPRLDLIGAGITEKVESPLGDGNYSGYVKITAPFTLHDPDANVTYGDNSGALAANGIAIAVPGAGSGWYLMTVNSKTLTYSLSAYMIGFIGDATPNGWNSPDSKMDYNAATQTWSITITLTNATTKFRLNDGWSWNLGGKGTGDGTADNYSSDGKTVALSQGGHNIPVLGGAGNYTVTLDINNSVATYVKN